MAEKIRLKGHEKFVLREGWLTKGLLAVQNNNKVFAGEKGADALGVGTNMVKAIRYYLQAFSLVNESTQKGTVLNEVGRAIVEEDPYIEDSFTLCLLHSLIANNEEKATTWYLFFNQKEISEFTKEDIVTYIHREIFAKYGKEVPVGSVKDDIDVLLNMYGKTDPFADPEDKLHSPLASLKLIKKDGDIYSKQQPNMKNISKDFMLYIISSLLQNEESISIDSVSTYMESVFCIPWVQTNELLDVLDREEQIRVDRTAGLDMIYPLNVPSPVEIINNYYRK